MTSPASDAYGADALDAALRAAGASVDRRALSKGEAAFTEGDAPDAAYYVDAGLMKIVKHGAVDGSSTIDLLGPGRLFGLVAVLDARPYPVTAVALQPARLVRLPAAELRRVMATSETFRAEVFREIGRHVRRSHENRSLVTAPVEVRVAHVLAALFEAMGPTVNLQRDEIAQLAGCTESSAVRAIIALREEGILSTGWKRLTLRAPERLAARLPDTRV